MGLRFIVTLFASLALLPIAPASNPYIIVNDSSRPAMFFF